MFGMANIFPASTEEELMQLVKGEVDLVQPSIDGQKVGGNAISWARVETSQLLRKKLQRAFMFRSLGALVAKAF